MAYGGGAAAGAAGAAAAIANAIKSSGAIIKMDPQEFRKIINRNENGLVVMATSKFFSTSYKYITSYRGLFFYTKSSEPLSIPSTIEVIRANNIMIPG